MDNQAPRVEYTAVHSTVDMILLQTGKPGPGIEPTTYQALLPTAVYSRLLCAVCCSDGVARSILPSVSLFARCVLLLQTADY